MIRSYGVKCSVVPAMSVGLLKGDATVRDQILSEYVSSIVAAGIASML